MVGASWRRDSSGQENGVDWNECSKSSCSDAMTRLLRFRRPSWVGSLVPQCKSGVKDLVWKHRTALGGSSFHSISPAPPNSTARQDASPQSEVSKSLSEILMALRTTNGKLNIENLSRNFQKEDRSFSGSLPLPKVTKTRVQMCWSPKATSGHWVYKKAQLWSVFCLWITLYTCFLCLRGEKKDNDDKKELWNVQNRSRNYLHWDTFYVNNRKYEGHLGGSVS